MADLPHTTVVSSSLSSHIHDPICIFFLFINILKHGYQAEIAIARRNAAMLAQQRWSAALVSVVPETPMGHAEVVLPQEWTY